MPLDFFILSGTMAITLGIETIRSILHLCSKNQNAGPKLPNTLPSLLFVKIIICSTDLTLDQADKT